MLHQRFLFLSGNIRLALGQGTQDACLFYHAGAIAMANGEIAEAKAMFARAANLRRMLLPSERRDLSRRRETL